MKFDLNISAKKILSIPDDEPGMLFSSASEAKNEYKALVKIWHPDLNKDPNSTDVFAKIGQLLGKAELWAEAGIWMVPGELVLKGKDGKSRVLRYKIKKDIDVGTLYYGPTVVAFVVHKALKEHFDNGVKAIKSFKYADKEMEKEFSRQLPKYKSHFELEDGRFVLVLEKTPDVLLLSDVLEQQGGKLDPRHAAWIGSRLHGLVCYFKWAGISHNGLTSDAVFVSPEFHSIIPLGGWWFSKKFGEKLKVVPKAIHSILPSSVVTNKIADDKVDRICLRALVREVAGDRFGITLKEKGVPKAMETYLRSPLGEDAFKENSTWYKILEESFGPRKFTVLDIKPGQIYDKTV